MTTQTPPTISLPTPLPPPKEKPKIELNEQTLPALRNLVNHKYRDDAKAAFMKYSGEDEKTPMGLYDLKSLLADTGLPKDLIDGEADKLMKLYDGDDDGKITVIEFQNIFTGK